MSMTWNVNVCDEYLGDHVSRCVRASVSLITTIFSPRTYIVAVVLLIVAVAVRVVATLEAATVLAFAFVGTVAEFVFGAVWRAVAIATIAPALRIAIIAIVAIAIAISVAVSVAILIAVSVAMSVAYPSVTFAIVVVAVIGWRRAVSGRSAKDVDGTCAVHVVPTAPVALGSREGAVATADVVSVRA